jgi:hypothetical protein
VTECHRPPWNEHAISALRAAVPAGRHCRLCAPESSLRRAGSEPMAGMPVCSLAEGRRPGTAATCEGSAPWPPEMAAVTGRWPGLRPAVLMAFGSCGRHLATLSVKGGSAEAAAGAALLGRMRM